MQLFMFDLISVLDIIAMWASHKQRRELTERSVTPVTGRLSFRAAFQHLRYSAMRDDAVGMGKHTTEGQRSARASD